MPSFDELYCLLVSLDGMKVILPREAVIEVTNQGALTASGQAPPWLLGWRSWNGNSIPVISLEALAGLQPASPGAKNRLIVVYAISGVLDPPHFAIMTRGYPYLLRTTEAVLKPQEDRSLPKGFLSRVRMGGESPLIPDFDTIEAELSSLNPAAA